MKTIIVPTDFSPAALNATQYAADMACYLHTSLTLLHVCRLPVAISEIPVPPETINDMLSSAREEIGFLKEEMLRRTGHKINIATEVRTGNVLMELKSFCDTIQPYAVVMGSHGEGAVKRLLFGSNTLQALNSLYYPLLIVPPGARFMHIRKAALACDLKNVIETVPVRAITDLVNNFHTHLYILHINRPDVPPGEVMSSEEFKTLRHILKDIHPVYHLSGNENTDIAINDFIEKNNFDLLVVIPKKHGLLKAILHKSHTRQLVLETHVPILSIHG